MKIRNILILSLCYLVTVSCVKEVANTQVTSSSLATNATFSTTSNQAKSLAKSSVKRSGSFISGEHTTQGSAHIITKAGKSFLELDKDFKTSESGPDLVIVLHRSDNIIGSTKPPAYPLKKGEYIILAPLLKYSGAQTYSIPQNINLGDYKSVAIWCRRFNATFGAASLSQ